MLAMIARMDASGLGNQTRNLVRLLKPDKILVIDMQKYNGLEQHPHWYKDYNTTIVKGMPNSLVIKKFLQDTTHLLSCEIFYNNNLVNIARQMGVKTYLQYNYEFLDHLQSPSMPLPDVLIAPSKWHYKEVQELVTRRRKQHKQKYDLVYIPPPLFASDYAANATFNLERKSPKARLLHIVGKPAIHNRNGTDSIYKALEHTPHQLDLVIKSQYPLDEYKDDRITYDYTCPDDHTKLYEGFDALILPRKFGGLCLPMNEALMSGLPVVMTDIPPNNHILPKGWLVPAKKAGSFLARTTIQYFEADPTALADKMNYFAKRRAEGKEHSRHLGEMHFGADSLLVRYKDLLK